MISISPERGFVVTVYPSPGRGWEYTLRDKSSRWRKVHVDSICTNKAHVS